MSRAVSDRISWRILGIGLLGALLLMWSPVPSAAQQDVPPTDIELIPIGIAEADSQEEGMHLLRITLAIRNGADFVQRIGLTTTEATISTEQGRPYDGHISVRCFEAMNCINLTVDSNTLVPPGMTVCGWRSNLLEDIGRLVVQFHLPERAIPTKIDISGQPSIDITQPMGDASRICAYERPTAATTLPWSTTLIGPVGTAIEAELRLSEPSMNGVTFTETVGAWPPGTLAVIPLTIENGSDLDSFTVDLQVWAVDRNSVVWVGENGPYECYDAGPDNGLIVGPGQTVNDDVCFSLTLEELAAIMVLIESAQTFEVFDVREPAA